MTVIIYHNPDCATSRNTLKLIRHFGIDPKVVEYLKTPPARAELEALIARTTLSPRQVVRKKGTPYAELQLDGADDAALIDAMMDHPILINRPMVATDLGAALCRPSDVVLDLLPYQPGNDAFKEDGAPFLRDAPVAGDDPALAAALHAAGLPVDDLTEPGRRFFAYRTLAGTPVGFGGYELYGGDALLRSIVVLPQARGAKIGRNLVPLLCYRAMRQERFPKSVKRFSEMEARQKNNLEHFPDPVGSENAPGARTAWLLTTSAVDFFANIGFKRRDRREAPAAILATRQAASLCPARAVVMSKKLGF